MKLRYLNIILLGAVSLCLIFFQSCSSRDEFIGTYVSTGGDKADAAEIIIELNDDGKGVWKKRDETVFFGWEVHHKALRLHLKLGGVIIGEINRNSIEISLPGNENILFQKAKTQ